MELGAQTYNLTGRYNGKPSAILAFYQLPGSNAVRRGEGVARADGGTAASVFRRTYLHGEPGHHPAVTAGMKEIIITLFEALGLVVVVVYIFLQGWRATLIPLWPCRFR